MQWPGDGGRWTDSPDRPFLLHPGDNLPHTDILGLPPWLQWAGLGLVVGIGAWMVADAWVERRAAGPETRTSEDLGERRPGERLVAAGPGGRRDARATTEATAEVIPPPPESAELDAAIPRHIDLTAGERAPTFSPPRSLVFALALAAGWLALDRVRAVAEVAAFIGSTGTTRATTLAFAFAALLWVGGALALVAPRGAALAFAAAGALGVFLSTASRWEARLEWWGAGAAADQWEGLPWWSAAAFALALLAVGAGRYRPRRRKGTRVD